MSPLTPSETLPLLERMLLIRHAEEQVIRFDTDHGLLPGNYHVYIGQEATGVGVCSVLGPSDYVFTTHRNHGHVIARGGEPSRVLAEILGRMDGYNFGRGGTFHVVAPHLGIIHTSAIVGGCVPLAAGAAFSIKERGAEGMSVAFFGDGSLEEGASYEGLMLASLWQLPVLFVCEHNEAPPDQRAGGESPTTSHPAKRLIDFPESLSIRSRIVDGADLQAVCGAAAEAAGRVRAGGGPEFLEVRTSPWPGNAGGPALHGGDFQLRWAFEPAAAPEQLREWIDLSDPVSLLARRMAGSGAAARADLEHLDRRMHEAAVEAARFALNSPLPPAERAPEYIFA